MSGAHRPSCCVAVKLWHTNMEHSVASLEAKANVCCVKFNPNSRYHLAFGSAGKQTSAQIPEWLVQWFILLERCPTSCFSADWWQLLII